MERGNIKSVYLHLIEVILYFFFVGFLVGGFMLIFCLAPMLILAALVWVGIVLCMWPVFLPIMITLKHTHMVEKAINFALSIRSVRKLIIFVFNKVCSM